MNDTKSYPYQISEAVTVTNKSSIITVVTALALASMLILLAVRLHIRCPWRNLFGLDDWMTLAASVLGLTQSIVVFIAVGEGLGRKQTGALARTVPTAQKLIYTSDLMYILATCLAKLAISLLFCRLAVSTKDKRIARAIGYVISGWGIVSVFVIALRSEHMAAPWTVELRGRSSLFRRWVTSISFGVVIEVMLLGFPVFLVRGLQMSRGSKLAVVVGFGLRIPTVALAIGRIIALHGAIQEEDQMLALTTPTILTQFEMHFNIMSATIPSLQVFLRSLNTGLYGTTLQQVDANAAATIAASKNSKDGSFPLSKTRKDNALAHPQRHKKAQVPSMRPWDGELSSDQVMYAKRRSASMSSDGSQDIIIKKTITIHYDSSNEVA